MVLTCVESQYLVVSLMRVEKIKAQANPRKFFLYLHPPVLPVFERYNVVFAYHDISTVVSLKVISLSLNHTRDRYVDGCITRSYPPSLGSKSTLLNPLASQGLKSTPKHATVLSGHLWYSCKTRSANSRGSITRILCNNGPFASRRN